jgi:hypothetical protein
MSRQVKDLLDEAAAGIEPTNVDPVAAVIQRGRIARAKVATAGGLAVVAVLTGGVVTAQRLAADPAPDYAAVPATRPDRPPTPKLVDGRIVAGAVSVAVPRGWRVLPIEGAPCGFHRRTVLIGEGPNPYAPSPWCTTAEIEVQSTFDIYPYTFASPDRDPAKPRPPKKVSLGAPRMLTLEGGEPGWLRTDPDGAHRFMLPWSRVEVTVRAGLDVRQQVVDSVTAGRWEPAALTLPERTEYATLTASVDVQGVPQLVFATETAKVRRVVELLRGGTVVDRSEICAREDQRTVGLEIGSQPDEPAPSDPVRGPRASTLVITLAAGCHEVVSEEGGRVRLDDASLAELGDLFGVKLP